MSVTQANIACFQCEVGSIYFKCITCSVQCSMYSMKCTGADAGEFAGACVVCSEHCPVCSVISAKYDD